MEIQNLSLGMIESFHALQFHLSTGIRGILYFRLNLTIVMMEIKPTDAQLDIYAFWPPMIVFRSHETTKYLTQTILRTFSCLKEIRTDNT